MTTQRLRALTAVTAVLLRMARMGRPRHAALPARLANLPTARLPLHAAVQIRWNTHQIPSIEASDDHDLAVALGAVHAHLRLSQIEVMRRLAEGRVAEIVGSAGIEIDRTMRLMRFGQTVPGMLAMMPPATRTWLEGFVAGLNHHIAYAPALPYEFAALDHRPEPWTLEQLLAASRLASTDVSWAVFGRLLRAEASLSDAEWEELWPLLQDGDKLPDPQSLSEAALSLVRGSNSAAVAAARCANGAGLIASDPHLPIMLPPLWLVVALHAPDLDAVGLMIPGIPVLGLGRNRHIAWGGTSLHAASSDLIDVTHEPMTARIETIPVRGRHPVSLTLRDTAFGPVVSDGQLLKSDRALALRWVGQRASDEFTALLHAMRAATATEFRTALRGFAIPGQTMVVVEANGAAERVIAAHSPRRAYHTMRRLVLQPEEAWRLDDLVPGTAFSFDDDGIVASANDRPPAGPVPLGFFFSMPERVSRLRSLLDRPAVTRDDMRALQLDVLQPRSLALRDALLPHLPPTSLARILRQWDGRYDTASRGALVFEALVGALAQQLVPRKTLAALMAVWTGRAMVMKLVLEAPEPAFDRAMDEALRRATTALRRYKNWGGVHRLGLRHPFARLPGLGHWFSVPAQPIAGSNGTINKTGHELVAGRHSVTFGACARHVSDMADPDGNWFVLMGGQDGWLGSDTMADQVPLWQAGQAIQVPLLPEPARSWPHLTVLTPP